MTAPSDDYEPSQTVIDFAKLVLDRRYLNAMFATEHEGLGIYQVLSGLVLMIEADGKTDLAPHLPERKDTIDYLVHMGKLRMEETPGGEVRYFF